MKSVHKSRPRLTIRDIAGEAGVSTATVSRVMNNSAMVAPETRDSVRAIIDRHGYVSDGIAVSLASARSMTIGLVIPSITNSIYAASTQAIQSAAQQAGYTVLLGISEFSASLEETLIRQLLERRVDGLILTGEQRRSAMHEMIQSRGVPFVITWKRVQAAEGPASVSFDNYKGARVAMQHLLDLGHRRIALICGRTEVNDRALERRQAYQDALSESGIAIDKALMHEADFELENGRNAMHRLLQLDQRPTAVFCANDIQCIGALFECLESGLDVPGDISLVGFDDLPAAQYVRPQLTTIRVPARQMGELAVKQVLESLRTGAAPVTQELPVTLIVRGSTAPLG